jgi:hypothetical protein
MPSGYTIYDFWLGCNIPKSTRAHRRQQRDGRCVDCQLVVVGFSRCAIHRAAHNEAHKRYRAAVKLRSVNTTA